MAQIPTMRSSLGEEDLPQWWLIGTTRSFLFWNSSAHQIKRGEGTGATILWERKYGRYFVSCFFKRSITRTHTHIQ